MRTSARREEFETVVCKYCLDTIKSLFLQRLPACKFLIPLCHRETPYLYVDDTIYGIIFPPAFLSIMLLNTVLQYLCKSYHIRSNLPIASGFVEAAWGCVSSPPDVSYGVRFISAANYSVALLV